MISNDIKILVDNYQFMLSNNRIFDINIWWDPIFTDGFINYNSPEIFFSALKSFNINEGIITSAMAARFDPYEGNLQIAELIKGKINFYGCMILTPDMFYKNGDEYIAKLKSFKFVAARVFPETYKHSMSDYSMGKLLNTLQSNGIPLFIWHSQVSFNDIDQICREYPKLSVIMDGHNVKYLYHAREYLSLLMHYKNFYIEAHNLVLFREIETIADLASCKQLVYGSYFPYHTPHFSFYNILTSDITQKQKAGILATNIQQILSLKNQKTGR